MKDFDLILRDKFLELKMKVKLGVSLLNEWRKWRVGGLEKMKGLEIREIEY